MWAMGLILVIVGVFTLFAVWPMGLLFVALGVWMMSAANRAAREEKFQARMLAEMQAQRQRIENEQKR
jgi:hypothetical protein